jgi:hypothetical protein
MTASANGCVEGRKYQTALARCRRCRVFAAPPVELTQFKNIRPERPRECARNLQIVEREHVE